MKKATIVINGAGGVGKDTLCDLAAKHIKIRNSAIGTGSLKYVMNFFI